MDVKELTNHFIQFEEKNNMFRVTLDHVELWHYIRRMVFHDLSGILTGFTPLLVIKPYTQHYKKTIWDVLKAKVKCNQFLTFQRDILIIPHGRKYIEDGHYGRCIYTDLIDKYLRQTHYVLDNRSVMNCYVPQKSRNIVYCDMNAYKKYKRIKDDNTFTSKREFEQKIICPLEDFFHIKIDIQMKKKWKNYTDYLLSLRKLQISYYHYMLNRIKPKLILIVEGYAVDRMVLSEVAKERNIPVIELQHGSIGEGTIPYTICSKDKIKSFPDYIFTFGKTDKENGQFPIEDSHVIPVGFPELERYVRKSHCRKEAKIILIVSQGLPELAQFAGALAEKIDEGYRIIYKLHPKEYGDWRKKCGKYLESPRIKVMGDFNRTIYSYLSKADWVIGAYSTVLSEATAFDVRIGVINLYDTYMNQLIDSGRAVFIESVDDFLLKMDDENIPSKGTELFFEKNSLENIQRNIDRILKEYNRK